MTFLIPPILEKQTKDFINTIPGGIVMRAAFVDADNFRVLYKIGENGKLDSVLLSYVENEIRPLTLPPIQETGILNVDKDLNLKSFEIIK